MSQSIPVQWFPLHCRKDKNIHLKYSKMYMYDCEAGGILLRQEKKEHLTDGLCDSLTLQPLQEVWAEDFGHIVEREAFQVDAGVQDLDQRARLELGKPC